jgi:hypothetical protein
MVAAIGRKDQLLVGSLLRRRCVVVVVKANSKPSIRTRRFGRLDRLLSAEAVRAPQQTQPEQSDHSSTRKHRARYSGKRSARLARPRWRSAGSILAQFFRVELFAGGLPGSRDHWVLPWLKRSEDASV